MSSENGFHLTIFVPDGDPDGLRIVERSNWIGKALMFPRALYPQVRNRDEFKQTGVYLLIGPRTDGLGEMLYIGEGDPVRPRFEQHYAGKDFWTQAVFFVAGQGKLNKAHVEFIEAKLLFLARNSKRMSLENVNTPSEPTLSEVERSFINGFLDYILDMAPVLGVHAFEQSPLILAKDETLILSCNGRGAAATGYDTPQGFVVRAGSFAASDEVNSLQKHFPNVVELRSALLKNGVLISEENRFRFTQAYTFSSPSLASDVVLGSSTNGRTAWKDSTGKTLKEIQQEQAKA